MKYDLVLFDLDGTLTDPKVGITTAAMYALESFGIAVDGADSLVKFIGPPLLGSFKDFYGMSDEQARVAVKKYQEYYARQGYRENKPYDGINEMLFTLKNAGKTLCMATSKSTVFARKIAEHFDIEKYFAFIAGCELDGTRGKKDEVISYALERLDPAKKCSAIMVGDTHYDIDGAKLCGLPAIGVTWGYGTRKSLADAKADYIFDTPKQVTEFLTK